MSFLSKHLPPSAGRPRVLALDAAAAALLAREGADAALVGPAQARFAPPALPFCLESFDALVAARPPLNLSPAALLDWLRPGGRIIIVAEAAARAGLLAALESAGCIHLFAEDAPGGVLVRGERPPRAAHPLQRIATLAGQPAAPALRLFDARANLLRQACACSTRGPPTLPGWGVTCIC